MSNDGGPTGGDLSPSQQPCVRDSRRTLHARHDGRESIVNARKAFAERFEHEVDPDGVLPVAERQRRAEHRPTASEVTRGFQGAWSFGPTGQDHGSCAVPTYGYRVTLIATSQVDTRSSEAPAGR